MFYVLMQQTVPKEPHEPLERPPKFEQSLELVQIPASAFGDVQEVPSNEEKDVKSPEGLENMDDSGDDAMVDTKFGKPLRNDGLIRRPSV